MRPPSQPFWHIFMPLVHSSRRITPVWIVSAGCGLLLLSTLLYWVYLQVTTSPQEEALALLECAGPVLEEFRIPYWLDYGCLLGAIRHGGFIPWDSAEDIDFNFLASDFEAMERSVVPALREACPSATIVTRNTFPTWVPNVGSWRIRRAALRIMPAWYMLGGYLDFHDVDKRTEDYNGEMVEGFRDMHFYPVYPFIPREVIFPLRRCPFRSKDYHSGEEVMIPCPNQPETLLSLLYGTDWRTPKQDYHVEDAADVSQREMEENNFVRE